MFSHAKDSQSNGAGDHVGHGLSSGALSKLQHTARTPEPAATAPTRCSQTESADGQSAYRWHTVGQPGVAVSPRTCNMAINHLIMNDL